MKQPLLFCSLIFSAIVSFAQPAGKSTDKMDAQLKLWVSDAGALYQQNPALYKTGPVSDPLIAVIFKTDGSDAKALVEKHKGKLHTTIGPIATAEIPLSEITAFAAEPAVIKVESSKDVQLHNDKAAQLVGVNRVQAGDLPGGTAYTGKGVLVGVIDTGIDFLHRDFRKKQDSTITRILNIWDQTGTAGTLPQGFSYGTEWTQAQINAELTTPGVVTQRDSSGHGTHVTGTAAGLRGMAYDAEIIFVKTPLVSNGDYTFTTSAKTLDAVNYVYQKAAALGKPCVVNMSLGFNFGAPHDGTSLFEQGIDIMVGSGHGFIVCASAGNEGNSYGHHGGYNLTQDSVWTYVNTLNGATWYAVSNKTFDDSIWVSVSVDSSTASFTGNGIMNQKTIFQTPWMKLKDLKDMAGGYTYPVLYGNGDTAATVRMVASSYDNDRTEWYIYPRDKFIVSTATSPAKVNLYKLSFKGAGSFHSWYQELNGLGVNIANFNGKTNARFKASDNQYSIGIPATGKKVFAVGAYVNKKDYVDILGRTQKGLNTGNLATGAIAPFSSIGPTLDGRVKPEFCAPGLNVASSHSRYAPADSTEMVDAQTIVFSGTSMSCPVTVGALALYLEQHPQSTFDQVRAAIDSATIHDAFVNLKGATPNNTWGFGKLDIFKAMGSPFHTGIQTEPDHLLSGTVFPNPASDKISFSFDEGLRFHTIRVFNITGNLVAEIPVKGNMSELDLHNWSNGLYIYQASGTQQSVSGKFVVE